MYRGLSAKLRILCRSWNFVESDSASAAVDQETEHEHLAQLVCQQIGGGETNAVVAANKAIATPPTDAAL
jgi:hypothetical protein